ncbi:hypothetical protein P3698_19440 [Vibrio parahaemolyticus]|nr:hypothetical protein [Vibrio parahaemolyticus]MDF5521896.1 hypothetical protein [Vibrio parahaemolyticus]
MLITSPKQLAIHLRDERKHNKLSQAKVADPVGLVNASLKLTHLSTLSPK